MIDINIVVACNNINILLNNLISGYNKNHFTAGQEIIIQQGYTNIPKAYNEAKPDCPVVMYVHQDVLLPNTFKEEFENSFRQLPDDWEVLGVAGVKLIDGKKFIRGHIMDRGKEWGGSTNYYNPVDTLDDMLLITRGNIKFDEQFEQDFYGPDICIGRKCYAIKAFCHHNSSRKIGERTESFYRSQELFRIKHKDSLPIACTYAMIEN